MLSVAKHFTRQLYKYSASRGTATIIMSFIVYLLENRNNKTWYIGFTTNLKNRLKKHNQGGSPYTSKQKSRWKLIYCELYLDKKDALGREKFLKSGAGHRFIKKQINNYLSANKPKT
jgi:putative endonuclease